MAFTLVKTLEPFGGPVLRQETISNSITVTELDSVKLSSGFVALGTAGALVFGHVNGIVTDDGVGVETTGAAGAESGSFVGTFTSASDNQTVAQVDARCDVSKFTMYDADLDATIATTTGSDLAGYKMDLTDEDTLDESTATTSTAQYNNHGASPEDSTLARVNIYESQVFGV